MFSRTAGGREGVEGRLQGHGWTFRYTHDLEELVTGLKQQGLAIPPEVDDAIVLTSFAWDARYPGLSEPVTPEEYKEAVRNAEAVVAWAEKEIGK